MSWSEPSSPQRTQSMFTLAKARSKFVPQYFCGICDPGTIQGKRGDPRETAAASRVPRSRGPADDPDNGPIHKDGRAGIPRAGAKAFRFAHGCGVNKADLQVSGPSGCHKARGAYRAAGLAVAPHRDPEARDQECVAG